MSRFHQTLVKIDDSMLDYNGHVNNVWYVKWMQDVAVKHAAECGCTEEYYKSNQVSWVARSHFIEYHQSAFDGDRIEIFTWIADSRKVSCRRLYRFYKLGTRELLASAATEWVFVNFETGRPKKIDKEMLSRFPQLGDEPNIF